MKSFCKVACPYSEPRLVKEKMATTSVWRKPGPFGADVQPQGRPFIMAFRAKGLMQRFLPSVYSSTHGVGKRKRRYPITLLHDG